ncbi:hypothetical protein AbraIFM66951_006722 [Aspergillus brasiliensis]|nr:hypothetical protein AbraIFM66951_006722 [Aspergillus brasiliensis]
MQANTSDQIKGLTPAPPSPPPPAPLIIGLYGVSGSGKTFIMKKLEQELGEMRLAFFEGSEVIASVTTGGLDAFKKLDEAGKAEYRKRAILKIKSICIETSKVGIVTGHLTFWDDERCDHPMKVYTQEDLNTFTHILRRTNVSSSHLSRWQGYELTELRHLCAENNILFAGLYPNLRYKLSTVIRDIERHNLEYNLTVAKRRLDEILINHGDDLQTVVFLDADKTLAEEDTSATFWRMVQDVEGVQNPLGAFFSSPIGYSYTAFRQAMLFYEDVVPDKDFLSICERIAELTQLYPQISVLLQKAARRKHVCPVIVTCGLRLVWEKAIERAGFADVVKVIGGGRIEDGLVMTPEASARKLEHYVKQMAEGGPISEYSNRTKVQNDLRSVYKLIRRQHRLSKSSQLQFNALYKEVIRALSMNENQIMPQENGSGKKTGRNGVKRNGSPRAGKVETIPFLHLKKKSEHGWDYNKKLTGVYLDVLESAARSGL